MGLEPILIAGNLSGLTKNVKPWLVPDQAFSRLYNAYVYRDRVKKKDCLKLLGRLQRVLTSQNLGATSAGTTFNLASIFTTLSITDTNKELAAGSLVITVVDNALTSTFTDNGNGTFTVTGAGTGVAAGSFVNYVTGQLHLVFTALVGGGTVTANLSYYPSNPCLGITQREISAANNDQAIFYDTTYAYIFTNSQFQEYIAGTTWADTNYNGYWSSNFIINGTSFYFVTNSVVNSSNPIRYTTNGSSWNTFAPALDATPNLLLQCLIILPYYGRMIALNTTEGTAYGSTTSYPNRCRFAKIGDPTGADVWKVNIPGNGGFIDAPTTEAIIGAAFYKNTLIVLFENSTWQLRYLGEYGLPFIWERISSDFGSVSTFSPITFDGGILAIGDKAIITSTDVKTDRIDLDIPDQIFYFQNSSNGNQRVQGARDFQKELVYWSFADAQSNSYQATFPNKVLVYNYRNNTWAIFRDNITAFGAYYVENNLTWDSETVTWDDEELTWDDFSNEQNFPMILSGNQQGFIHYYGNDETPNDASLSITGATNSSGQIVQLTVNNHNMNDLDVFYISGMNFINSTTKLSVTSPIPNGLYSFQDILNANAFNLTKWNGTSYALFEVDLSTVTYVGGGTIALMPRMDIITKDFNPYQNQGKQMKISSVDLQTDVSNAASVTINLLAGAQNVVSGNLTLGNTEVETYLPNLSYAPNPTNYYPTFPSEYAWHRFYATMVGQFLRIQITYDDVLMNILDTHQEAFELNGIKLNIRPGGHLVF